MKKPLIVLSLLAGLAMAAQAYGSVIRATALTPEMLGRAMRGEIPEVTIEFRQGDRLPVTFTAEGDLLESAQISPSYWSVKRDFYVRYQQSQFQLSLDGKTFKPYNEIIRGEL